MTVLGRWRCGQTRLENTELFLSLEQESRHSYVLENRQLGLSSKVHMEKSFEPIGFLNMTLNLSLACATSKRRVHCGDPTCPVVYRDLCICSRHFSSMSLGP